MDVVDHVNKKHKPFKAKPKLKKRHTPIVKEVFTDLWNNLVLYYEDPSFGNFMATLTDLVSYFIMPLHGGWQLVESHRMYLLDKRAYNDAGVTEDYLFK